mmetsp:Transcript_17988/g.27241  ORF Transcript_17988/g.27241 Transcript_17988/m.27241 type:complete len:112 (-) Transcript_17988:4630-4965(-)
MRNDIQRKFEDMKYGTPPLLLLPSLLQAHEELVVESEEEAYKPSAPPVGGEKEAPKWHETNPGRVEQWALPEGKTNMSLFQSNTDEGKSNLSCFPMVTHHNTPSHTSVRAR